MHFDQNAFGQRVKHFRNKRGLTLEQMSTALNISIDHLSRIELGKRGASMLSLLRPPAIVKTIVNGSRRSLPSERN